MIMNNAVKLYIANGMGGDPANEILNFALEVEKAVEGLEVGVKSAPGVPTSVPRASSPEDIDEDVPF